MKKAETIAALLQDARRSLFEADIELSALDARLLLQAASEMTHEQLIAEPNKVLPAEKISRFKSFIDRRLQHEPVTRILGEREFYGRPFQVSPAVLDPRADTETIIELTLQMLDAEPKRILDLGTGSGAIAVTLLAERHNWSGVAVDLSAEALEIAKANANALGVARRLVFKNAAWLNGIAEKFDLIVSNPPYIPQLEVFELSLEVQNFDPHMALDGGGDGLDAYRAIAAGSAEHLNSNGLVILEIGAGQSGDVTAILKGQGFELAGQKSDLGGHVRVLAFKPRSFVIIQD
jgi:release factor glutamine methyltransferase